MKHPFLYILLLLAALVVAGCSDDISVVPADPSTEPTTTERALVPLTFEASLAAPAPSPGARAEFNYGSGVAGGKNGKGLKLAWSAKDALGVYIRTTEGTILRAGSITSTGTAGDETRTFNGHVLQKFEGEDYIYMHPDLGNSTAISFAEQYGAIGNASPLDTHLPIVWKAAEWGGDIPTQGAYKGYAIRLLLNFQEDPGNIRKIILHTDKCTTADRIFPRSYTIDHLLADAPFAFDAPTLGTKVSEAIYTDAISLNVSGTPTATANGDGTYSVEAYLASACVTNLNLFNSKLRVEVINEQGRTYANSSVSFKGQSGATASKELLAQDVFRDGSLRKMEQTMSVGGITPTIINYQYNIASILGMWNEYGQPYDPNGLIFLKDGTGGTNANMPQVLITNGVGQAIHDRYRLTNSPTGTPTFTWQLYESQNTTYADGAKQADATCNNIDITDDTEIYVSFLSEYAWNQNLLGYYHYPTGNPPANAVDVMKNIIFPNLSKPGHEPFNTAGSPSNNIGKDEDAPMREYMTVKLIYTNPSTGVSTTTFPAGTTIGFWGMIDVKANGFQQSQFSLLNWNQWRFFSNSAWNAANNKWSGAYLRCNFFASGDICNTPSTEVENIIPGVAIYGFKDNVTNDQNTAYSTCIFLVSASNTAAMTTHNKACFNIGCKTSPYPTQNIVLTK